MPTLNPAPSELGLASPALGPWFAGDSAITLPIPNGDLSVSITLGNNHKWQAPASGTVGFSIATAIRPHWLAHLRQENGTPAFSDNNIVALFTLLPEVEVRLHRLMEGIPSTDGNTYDDEATRPRLRYFALEFSVSGINDFDDLLPGGFPTDITTDTEKAEYLGFKLSGTTLQNGEGTPTSVLRRPQKDPVLIRNASSSNLSATLWVFDYRGRPVDPGAAAAWYKYLATVPWDNLWADSDAANQNTVDYTPFKSLHMVNAHEGPLPTAHLGRLNLTDLTQISGSNALYQAGSAPSIGLTSAPDPDDAPLARIAFLPHIDYVDANSVGTTPLAQWSNASWPSALNRDFVRAAFVDVEQHLVGLNRTNANQNRASTRIEARQNTQAAPALNTLDAVAQAVIALYANNNATTFVSPVLDKEWGALTAPDLGTGVLPEQISFTARAIQGAGTAAGDTVSQQSVVMLFDDSNLPDNGWIRVWPKGIDSETGHHFPMDGGGGRIDGSGKAWVVVPLPDGAATPSAPMACDVVIVTNEDVRMYSDQRFDRPALSSGSNLTLPTYPSIPSGTTLRICETGATFNRGTDRLGPGQTLLAVSDSSGSEIFQLIDNASLDAQDLAAGTLINQITDTDTLVVTKPAYGTIPEGSITNTAPNNATVVYRDRNGLLDTLTESGRPVPGMERNEMAIADTTASVAVVGGAPGRARWHEEPPAQLSHAGLPAAPEVHAAGIQIRGPAIVPVAELLRERATTSILELAQAAATTIPEPPTAGPGTTAWTAVLDTMTYGTAGEATLRSYLALGGSISLGQTWDNLKTDIQNATGVDLDSVLSGLADTASLSRAFDRLLQKTNNGAYEGLTALLGAINRAEDFVYIETPAIDNADITDAGVQSIISALTTRMGQRRGLRVMLCVPEEYMPDQPKQLRNVRKAAIADALKSLRETNAEHVSLFTPTAGPGRYLHFATTVVIVDDVFAMVGTTHLWRRGLTFDSSIAATLFDESVSDGRSTDIMNLRRQLLADRLSLDVSLVPNDVADIVYALNKLNAIGGLGRIKANAFPAKDDTTSTTIKGAWNPDGTKGAIPGNDWFLFFNSLGGSDQSDFSNAVR